MSKLLWSVLAAGLVALTFCSPKGANAEEAYEMIIGPRLTVDYETSRKNLINAGAYTKVDRRMLGYLFENGGYHKGKHEIDIALFRFPNATMKTEYSRLMKHEGYRQGRLEELLTYSLHARPLGEDYAVIALGSDDRLVSHLMWVAPAYAFEKNPKGKWDKSLRPTPIGQRPFSSAEYLLGVKDILPP